MNRRASLPLLFAVPLGAALASGCAEGELEDPPPHVQPTLLEFEGSACKKLDETAQSVLSGAGQPLVSTAAYAGLECLEWELTALPQVLTLRLLNFDHDCVESWDGRVERSADGELDFVLENAECDVGDCGACLYDLRFDVTDFAYAGGLDVRVGSAPCADEAPTVWHERLRLPLDTQPEGILCRYADGTALDEYAVLTARCGARNMPCGEESLCASGTDTGCESGLDCALIGGSDVSRCLATCREDDDCTPSDTLACVDGLCQLH